MRVQEYFSKVRTNLANQESLQQVGIYIIAYLGRVLYVGKSNDSVVQRLKNHMYKCDLIGVWMHKVRADWENVALDVLEAPYEGNVDVWLRNAEALLVKKLNPLFNEQLVLENNQ